MQTQSNLIRRGGLAAMLGGALFVVGIAIFASQPSGPGLSEPYRGPGASIPLLLISLPLLALGVAGLAVRARRAGRFGILGNMGLIVGAAGFALVAIGFLIRAVFFGATEFPLMPYFFVPGGLGFAAGFLLLGVAILRARVLPRWAAALLVVGALAMLAFNDQNWQSLMAMPFGIAWAATGYALWSEAGPSTRETAHVR